MAPIDTSGAMYGQLFADSPEDYIFVRTLSSGHACCTQLVHNAATGGICVRKALCVPRSAAGADTAAQEFDRDVRIASRLLAVAAEKGQEVRIPKLLAASTPASASAKKVSYWDLCNGGTLFAFLVRCKETGSALPHGLALHILQQTLETLEFMHTAPEHPVFHQDLHENNIVLHFTPGRALPDVMLIDFGRAVSSAPEDEHPVLRPRGTLPWWDIWALLRVVEKGLVPRTASTPASFAFDPVSAGCATRRGGDKKPRSRADSTSGTPTRTDPQRKRARTASASSDGGGGRGRRDRGDKHSNYCNLDPLGHAMQMLEALHRTFVDDVIAASQHARESKLLHPRSPRPPSLAKVICFLRRVSRALQFDVRFGEVHAGFRAAVLTPTRARAESVMTLRPRLCHSIEGLLTWLEDCGGKGPWDVAEVDEDGELQRVLRGRIRAKRKLEAWERMEEEAEVWGDEGQGGDEVVRGGEVW